jgi:hypothetical protein
MVNAIRSLVLRPDPIRHAIYRVYEKLPRAIAIPLEMWSNDLTYGRLIDAAEKAGDRNELQSLYNEASMYRSMLEDERLERESLRLGATARRHLVAIPHYDGHDDYRFWEQSHRNGRVRLTIEGVAEARKAIDEDFNRRWGRRMFWINFFGTLGILKFGWDLLKPAI